MKRQLAGMFVTLLATLVPVSGHTEEKLEFSGDLRGRWEMFRFSQDELGNKDDTRGRLRYRLRLNASATINEHAALAIRVGTGAADNRSGNQTLGSPVDFGPNAITIRRAYVTLWPLAGGTLPGGDGKWEFQLGRVPNPFLWKHGQDKMLWDGDINPSGITTRVEKGGVFATASYFVVDENSTGNDAFLGALQGGGELASETAKVGARVSYFHLENLDEAFVLRGVDGTNGSTSGGGNIFDGVTGDSLGGTMNVVEVQGYAKVLSSKEWPVTVFGGFASNSDAKASVLVPEVGKEASAYNVGAQIGDKKKNVQLGFVYYYIEANAFPSQYIDSDMLDGRTNRKGLVGFLARQVWKGTDASLTVLGSDAIKTGPGFDDSVEDSERIRTQLDLSVKF